MCTVHTHMLLRREYPINWQTTTCCLWLVRLSDTQISFSSYFIQSNSIFVSPSWSSLIFIHYTLYHRHKNDTKRVEKKKSKSIDLAQIDFSIDFDFHRGLPFCHLIYCDYRRIFHATHTNSIFWPMMIVYLCFYLATIGAVMCGKQLV